MHIFWGCLIAAIGLALFIGGYLKSQFVLYRLLVARSKLLWGTTSTSFTRLLVSWSPFLVYCWPWASFQ